MNKKLSFLLFVLASAMFFAQTNIYVSTTGNDATGNGSIAAPYATIAKAADIANTNIIANPTTAVNILVRGGVYRNSGFTTNNPLDANSYDPQNAGEAIWKQNNTTGTAVRINNVNGNANAWITIKPYSGEQVTIEGDGDTTFSIRSSSYIKVEGFEIKGVLEKIPALLAWKYWGTYRYLNNGSYVYGDRKNDICTQYNISPCTDIPPNIFTTGNTYSNLPNINSLNVERPSIFGGKGLLIQLSHHIDVTNNEIHHFPGGGFRVTQSDFVNFTQNKVHHNTSRASVGTHGVVAEGLSAQSGDNSATRKLTISENLIYSNYNEIYSWVQSKTIVTTAIDEGKGLALLRTSPTMSNFNGIIRVENNIAYDNGKSGIHTNDVDNAEIINNTVYNNGHTNIYNADISAGPSAGISIQSSNNIKIINNISVVKSGLNPPLQALSEGQNCTGKTVSNNIIFGVSTSDFAGGYTIADPLFIDMNNNNVRLQSTSPAIDNALANVAPTTDFYGNSRTTPDIGAVEYISSSLNTNENLKNTEKFSVFPNPTKDGEIHVLHSEKEGNLYIYNTLGQFIKEIKLKANETKINISDLENGIYLLKKGNQVVKIIKSN
jgi:parallel beta-helix repeat protein